MKEIWKTIRNYKGYYEISQCGNVRSIKRTITHSTGKQFTYKTRILKAAVNKYGYLQVGFSKNGETKSYTVHSLVAKAFIKNIYNKSTVNHKDGNKLNNHKSNLEWATKSEQAIHSLELGLRKMPNAWQGKFGSSHGASKKIVQLSLTDKFITEYGSIIEAGEIISVTPNQISLVCKGRRKTCKGFKWKYAKDYYIEIL